MPFKIRLEIQFQINKLRMELIDIPILIDDIPQEISIDLQALIFCNQEILRILLQKIIPRSRDNYHPLHFTIHFRRMLIGIWRMSTENPSILFLKVSIDVKLLQQAIGNFFL